MKWKEIKELMEKKGVTDDMEMNYIDIMFSEEFFVILEDDNIFHAWN